MKLICCGDLHLRERAPKARTDNYFAAQNEKVDWLMDLVHKEEIAFLLSPGDVFNSNPPTEFIKRWFIYKLKNWGVTMFAVFGQHDMLHHSLKSLDRTGLGVLEASGVIGLPPSSGNIYDTGEVIVVGCNWGQEVPRVKKRKWQTAILLIHRMIIKEKLWPGQEADYGRAFLKKYKEYDLIVSGDNHHTFIFRDGKRILYNAGSFMRMSADQFAHEPEVGIYDTETKKLKRVKVPIRPAGEVLSREHIEEAKEKDERMLAFVESLKTDYDLELSFRRNLETFFEGNKVRKSVRELIWESM